MTTLHEARAACIKLAARLPAESQYADLLAIVADYLDDQVPLNVEILSMQQRIRVLESMVDANAKPAKSFTSALDFARGLVAGDA